MTNTSDMRQIILDFPTQFKVGVEAVKDIKIHGKFKAVIICAMGGSALGGEILKTWLEDHKTRVPLIINRNYSLPKFVDKEYLVLFISYSGNTEEVLSAFKEAQRKKLKIAAITSGGKLAKACKKKNVPLVLFPKNYPPRTTLGFQFGSLVKLLFKARIIKNKEKAILSLEKELSSKKLEAQGKRLAKKLKNKIPLIYASDKIKEIARIWKIKFNENSKVPSFHNYLPELNHNEMVGFSRIEKQKIGKFHALILRDAKDNPKILKRMKLTAEILRGKKIKVDFIKMEGKNTLSKIFSSLILSDWASYYLALENKIDPIPVELVEKFKKKMKK